MEIRPPVADDCEAMAALAVQCQADPALHVPYLGSDAESIAADIRAVDQWTDTSMVAVDRDRLVGWLVAEIDHEMGRLWWLGPFVASDRVGSETGPAGADTWHEVAARLYLATRAVVSSAVDEEEACGDERSAAIAAWAARHGFEPDPASVLLRRERSVAATDPRVRPMATGDEAAIEALHTAAFPGTHTTAEALVASTEPRLVIDVGGRVVGYVACEHQSDGSGYIDFLAVEPGHRGQGLGRALVDHACHDLFAAGASYAHLTVREDNPAARALYASLGFVEERLARPYRIGFRLP